MKINISSSGNKRTVYGELAKQYLTPVAARIMNHHKTDFPYGLALIRVISEYDLDEAVEKIGDSEIRGRFSESEVPGIVFLERARERLGDLCEIIENGGTLGESSKIDDRAIRDQLGYALYDALGIRQTEKGSSKPYKAGGSGPGRLIPAKPTDQDPASPLQETAIRRLEGI